MDDEQWEITLTKHDIDLVAKQALEYFHQTLPKGLTGHQLQIIMILHGFQSFLSRKNIPIKIKVDL